MDVTLITRNVITLDNLMQMSPLLSEQGGKKKSPECVFSLKYTQYSRNSPAKVKAAHPGLVTSPAAPASACDRERPPWRALCKSSPICALPFRFCLHFPIIFHCPPNADVIDSGGALNINGTPLPPLPLSSETEQRCFQTSRRPVPRPPPASEQI